MGDYLDDRLSAAERARADERLAGDAPLREELAAMREVRGELKRWLSANSASNLPEAVRLPTTFAESVVDAAIDRAREEGLDDSHPLIRAGSEPATLPLRRPVAWWRNVGIAAAAAASILIGGFLMMGGDDSAIAEMDDLGTPIGVMPKPRDNDPADLRGPLNQAADPAGSDRAISNKSMLADVSGTGEMNLPDVTLGDPETDSPDLKSIAAGDSVTEMGPDTNLPDKMQQGETPVVDAAEAGGPAMLDVMLAVFEIDVKDEASQASVISDTIQILQQDPESLVNANREMVRMVERATQANPNVPYQLLYVAAPSKWVEQAYAMHLADRDRVNGVRMTALDGSLIEQKRLIEVRKRQPNLVDGRRSGDVARAIQDEGLRFYWLDAGREGDPIRKALDGAVFFQGGNSLAGLTPSGLDTIAHVVFLFR